MILLNLSNLNEYTCQYCFQTFKAKEEYIIEPEFYPVCSSKCGFMIVYNFVKNAQFDDLTLVEMQKIAEKSEEIKNFKRSDAFYSISKYYAKIGLSSLKFFKLIGQSLSNGTESLSSGTIGQQNMCMKYTYCPMSCPMPVPETTFSLSNHFDKNRGIQKWF